MSSMLEMMKQMMGQGKKGQQPGNKPGKSGEGNQGGEGQSGDSNMSSEKITGDNSAKKESRRLPKKSGSAGTNLPSEFKSALDAFNKGLETSK